MEGKKYYRYIEQFLGNFYPLAIIDKMTPEEIIDKFQGCYEPNIQIDALCDMARLEIKLIKIGRRIGF